MATGSLIDLVPEGAPLIRVDPAGGPPEALELAVELLRRGQLVVLPTDTGYALSGCATDESVLEAVYASKDRDPTKPLHVIVSGLAMAERLVRVDARARRLVAGLLPGPLTLVLPAAATAPRNLNRA